MESKDSAPNTIYHPSDEAIRELVNDLITKHNDLDYFMTDRAGYVLETILMDGLIEDRGGHYGGDPMLYKRNEVLDWLLSDDVPQSTTP